MNQRSLHSSSHAAMLRRQPVKRLDGLGVAQKDGDLPPLRTVGRLALSAGLGLGHDSAQQLAEFGGNACGAGLHFNGGSHRGFRRVATELAGLGAGSPLCDRAQVCGHGEEVFLDGLRVSLGSGHAEDEGGSFGWGLGSNHFVLRVGPIPTMSQSYAVTSDESTTVCRVEI